MGSETSLDLTDQVSRLVSRKMLIADSEACRAFLYDNNYYRLAGLWRSYQEDPDKGLNDFTRGISIEDVEEISDFERCARSVLSDGLLRFEMVLKARLAFQLASSEGGPFAYLDRSSYVVLNRGPRVDGLLKKIGMQLTDSRDTFIVHARNKNRKIPIWAAVEVLSFGTISSLYSQLNDDALRYRISTSFGFDKIGHFSTVIHTLSLLRNICAHGGRLWNRSLPVPPPISISTPQPDFEPHSLMARIVHLRMILERIDGRNSSDIRAIDDALKRSTKFTSEISYPSL